MSYVSVFKCMLSQLVSRKYKYCRNGLFSIQERRLSTENIRVRYCVFLFCVRWTSMQTWIHERMCFRRERSETWWRFSICSTLEELHQVPASYYLIARPSKMPVVGSLPHVSKHYSSRTRQEGYSEVEQT